MIFSRTSLDFDDLDIFEGNNGQVFCSMDWNLSEFFLLTRLGFGEEDNGDKVSFSSHYI